MILALAGTVGLMLHNQTAVSQSVPPPSFNNHYKEVDFSVPSLGTSQYYHLPVQNRSVHALISIQFSDGQYGFAERTFFNSTTAGELRDDTGWVYQDSEGIGNGGLVWFANTNGIYLYNDSPIDATVHVAVWY